MRILLIRHGSREDSKNTDGKNTPLTPEGQKETRRLGELLVRLSLKPEAYLTSQYRHSQEMGGLLAGQFDGGTPAPVISLSALTPHSSTHSFNDIIQEAYEKSIDLEKHEVVAIIGHEARLSQLLTRLTSLRTRPFSRAEAICLAADSFETFLQGNARIEFRIPVNDFQEDKLRSKIQSKMSVSTFLAGFTFAALIGLLTKTSGDFTILQMVSAIGLTFSLALFIAAIYMYDRLSMPEGFWVYDDRPTTYPLFRKQFKKDLQQQGPLYAHMVWTWGFVFTPAVIFGFIGFMAIVINTLEPIIIAGGTVAIFIVVIFYFLGRPKLGTD